jgi:uncharacterized protein (DUF1800 family)
MRSGRIKFVVVLFFLSLACVVPSLLAKKRAVNPASGQNDQKRAVHALNRLTFGPRPDDVQQVMTIGVDKWIDLQLHPDKIKNDVLESRLAPLRTLRLSTKEIVEEFPDTPLIKAVFEGKKPMPSDAAKRAVYQVQIARLQEHGKEKKERQAEVATNAATPPPANDANRTQENGASIAPNTTAIENEPSVNQTSMQSSTEAKLTPEEDAEARRREAHLYADLKVQQLIDLTPDQRYRKVLAMSTDEHVAFADSLRGGKGQEFVAGMDPKQKETLMAMNNPSAVIVDELVQAKLLRVVYSERQLEEVMTDFWFNHFNVYVGKGLDRLLLTTYEQDVIRPRVFGKFEDLLVASAKSPAMLFYLDNWLSVGQNSPQAFGIPVRPMGPYGPRKRLPGRFPRPNVNAKRRQNSGLNENYGRELLELHTVSVNGGYSQRDVTEVAKVFTGWTIDKPFEGGGFRYDPRMHEPGPKFVLGHRIKPKGEDEGREVLHRLATSPQTAHFIALKLAQRFVSDNPPETLVDRMAKTFLKKKGDIREVLTTLFHSPEFWANDTYRAKMKTPLEFVASAVRATGADVEDALPLTRQLGNMGMPLYGAQPPTGYSMKAETWVSSSALLNRMNFALALTRGNIRGVKVDTALLTGNNSPTADATQALTAMAGSLLAGDISKQTQDSIATQMGESQKTAAPETKANDKDRKVGPAKPAHPPDKSTIAGLLLGSPEFQRK